MIYAEEKEPPSRRIHALGAVRLTAEAHNRRVAAGFNRISPARPVLTGVLSE
jgi:hypothetical protein